MKCELCEKDVAGKGLLCPDCDWERLAAASAARLFSGSGLTHSNANEYSQKNWIASERKRRKIENRIKEGGKKT